LNVLAPNELKVLSEAIPEDSLTYFDNSTDLLNKVEIIQHQSILPTSIPKWADCAKKSIDFYSEVLSK